MARRSSFKRRIDRAAGKDGYGNPLPRVLGTNPRELGTNPKSKRDRLDAKNRVKDSGDVTGQGKSQRGRRVH